MNRVRLLMKTLEWCGRVFAGCLLLLLTMTYQSMAQNSKIKVDLDQAGRPVSQVNALGYMPWVITPGRSISKTFGNVKVTFSKKGEPGSELKSDWYKAGVSEPYNAKLVGDGITVDDGNEGGTIEMRISGLAQGKHTLLTFFNTVQSAVNNTFSPIDIYVDGK